MYYNSSGILGMHKVCKAERDAQMRTIKIELKLKRLAYISFIRFYGG